MASTEFEKFYSVSVFRSELTKMRLVEAIGSGRVAPIWNQAGNRIIPGSEEVAFRIPDTPNESSICVRQIKGAAMAQRFEPAA